MPNERRARIREYIESHGEASMEELAELCSDCSSMTLWRDLKKLEDEGAIRRKRNGAIAMRLVQIEGEGLYAQLALANQQAKNIIANLALPYVQSRHSVFLDAGSTIMAVVKQLPDEYYSILTSGTNISSELSQRSKCNVSIVGGQVNGNTLSCSGPQAEVFIEGVNIDIAIMATSGYSLNSGFTSGSFSEHQLKRKVIKKAKRVIMLMDHSKLDHSMPYTFGTLQDIDVLITDVSLPQEIHAEAERCGVTIINGNGEL